MPSLVPTRTWESRRWKGRPSASDVESGAGLPSSDTAALRHTTFTSIARLGYYYRILSGTLQIQLILAGEGAPAARARFFFAHSFVRPQSRNMLTAARSLLSTSAVNRKVRPMVLYTSPTHCSV